MGYLKFFPKIHAGAGRLLAIAQRRVKNQDAVIAHGTPCQRSCGVKLRRTTRVVRIDRLVSFGKFRSDCHEKSALLLVYLCKCRLNPIQ